MDVQFFLAYAIDSIIPFHTCKCVPKAQARLQCYSLNYVENGTL
jgi:hypothetical protein